jgi:hypothetical protein
MRLKPAWSKPISPPSSTTTSLVQRSCLDALDGHPHPLDGVGDRVCRCHEQDPSGEQADHHEKEDRHDQLVAAGVATAQKRHGDGDQGHSRAEGPGNQQARAGAEGPARLPSGWHLSGECEREQGAERPLAEQECHRRARKPGEQDSEYRPGDEDGRMVGRGDHAEDAGRNEPSRGRETGGAPGQAQDQRPLLARWRSALGKPALDWSHRPPGDPVADQRGNEDVAGCFGQVEEVLVVWRRGCGGATKLR